MKKKYILIAVLPLVLGVISGFLNSNSKALYQYLVKPKFAPNAFVFPIVWTILYILMGISIYLILMKKPQNTNLILIMYYVSLFFNFTYSFIFFKYKLFLLAFLWIIALLILGIETVISYLKVDKIAGLLQIPYVFWLLFAAYLNLSIYFLN